MRTQAQLHILTSDICHQPHSKAVQCGHVYNRTFWHGTECCKDMIHSSCYRHTCIKRVVWSSHMCLEDDGKMVNAKNTGSKFSQLRRTIRPDDEDLNDQWWFKQIEVNPATEFHSVRQFHTFCKLIMRHVAFIQASKWTRLRHLQQLNKFINQKRCDKQYYSILLELLSLI